jgi:hypothetical protein
MSLRAEHAGRAALACLRAGPATVFASFERSCYVETDAGIACLGGAGLGRGPLNAIVEGLEFLPVGFSIFVETDKARLWKPAASPFAGKIPELEIPESIGGPARAFLDWLAGSGEPDDALVGLGPGLTPAGDDFIGGAMIALRAYGTNAGYPALADRIAAWALPLAQERTNRISRAHLECAAAGDGHEALHRYLVSFDRKYYEQLARVGHTSGLDAAAGAVLALGRTAGS